MEAEMKMVFQQKVQEKEQKLKQSEEELYARHREMKEALEKQRLELEDKKRRVESGRPLTPEKGTVSLLMPCRVNRLKLAEKAVRYWQVKIQPYPTIQPSRYPTAIISLCRFCTLYLLFPIIYTFTAWTCSAFVIPASTTYPCSCYSK